MNSMFRFKVGKSRLGEIDWRAEQDFTRGHFGYLKRRGRERRERLIQTEREKNGEERTGAREGAERKENRGREGEEEGMYSDSAEATERK